MSLRRPQILRSFAIASRVSNLRGDVIGRRKLRETLGRRGTSLVPLDFQLAITRRGERMFPMAVQMLTRPAAAARKTLEAPIHVTLAPKSPRSAPPATTAKTSDRINPAKLQEVED